MADFLDTSIDKFTFRVATDRLYSADGVWLKPGMGSMVRVGVSDYLQQHSGDVAFVSTRSQGTILRREEEFAALETIKVNLSLTSPVAGTIVEVNPALGRAPELLNQDPYGEGWLATIEATNWEAEKPSLLEADAYFALMKSQVEAELERP